MTFADRSSRNKSRHNPGRHVSYPNDLFLFDRNGSPLWKYRTGGPIRSRQQDNTYLRCRGQVRNLYLFNRPGVLS